jgi:pimeloyl-ACP methyl ester carboxylesterase
MVVKPGNRGIPSSFCYSVRQIYCTVNTCTGWEDMPTVTTDDDVSLYYEETGHGTPIIFVHEFAGDHRSWEPQLRYFGHRYRCIAFNARGFPPSDVPESADSYSQNRARDDIRSLMDALEIDRAHIVGLSMGGFATLHFGFTYPERAMSLVIAGCGYGAEPDKREQFASEARATAESFRTNGMQQAAEGYGLGPTRVQYQNKDIRGWQEFIDQLREHSTEGSALTMIGVQSQRPSLYELQDQIATINIPTLVITGDEDWPCLEPAIMLKRKIATAGLVVMANSGHAINIEEPAAFNTHLSDFYAAVEVDAWPVRDPRAMRDSILSNTDD